MRPETLSYVERKADKDLYQRILAGDFCCVLTPRQMGKSSLMARTAKLLREREEKIRTSILDLSSMGGEPDKPDAWYYGLARRLIQDLQIAVDFKAWWQERSGLPALQRLSETFELLLSKTPDRLVVFVDEIDWTIRLPYSDDFFAAIRACYNARATNPEYQRLTFILLGVASPSDLIKDPTRTPFNIGYRLDLTDFTQEEAKPLEKGLHQESSMSELILRRVLYWTGGHPYLTQKLCDLLARAGNGSASEQTVDHLVQQHFLAPEAGRAEANLTFVRDRILRDKRRADLLKMYLRVVRGKNVTDDPRSPIHSALKLSGLVVPRDGGLLTVRNRIYEQVFTERWAKDAMPANWNQRVAVASVVSLLMGFSIWYMQFLPRPYIEALQNASEDYPANAYTALQKIPGYAGKADELLAEYWDRRAIRFAATGERDLALFVRLQGLTAWDSDIRRREANLLVGSDYDNLVATYRHGETVTAIAFSPDGKLALTGSQDRTARLWRIDTGAPVGLPLRHENSVTAVAFSPDGKLALTGSEDRTARLWRTDTGAPVGQPLRHEGTVYAVAFSPDGKLAVTGSGDFLKSGTARLWRTDTGAPVGQALRHTDAVTAVAFSPDGKLALTGSEDRTARLWRTDTGAPVGQPLRHEGTVYAVALSPDGKLALTGSSDGSARLWNIAQGKPIGQPLRHRGQILAVAFSPDGRFALTGSVDDTAQLWRASTGEPIGRPFTHEAQVLAVTFSSDSKLILTGSTDYTARLWRTDTGTPVGRPLRHAGAVRAVALSPDGKLALTGSYDGTARLWRIDTGTPAGQFLVHESAVSVAALSPDGEFALTGSSDGSARLWRTDTGAPIGQALRHTGAVRAVAISPDGRLALTSSEYGNARLWRIDTGAPVGQSLRHESRVMVVAFSPDGKLALTGHEDRTARLWRTDTGAPVGQPMRHGNTVTGIVTAVALSPDGKLALTGGYDGMARLWRTDTGASLGQPLRHAGKVMVVAFSPDGKLALTGSRDGTARLWRTDTGTPVGQPLRHAGKVMVVAFSPDGNLALTATQWWIHLSEVSNEGLAPTANRLLPGTWSGGYRFLNESGKSIEVALRNTAESVRIETLRLDTPEASPIAGKPEALMKEWQKKLALKFEAGKIVPLYDVPISTRDSGSRSGGF
jgi:WD40 repeat protein